MSHASKGRRRPTRRAPWRPSSRGERRRWPGESVTAKYPCPAAGSTGGDPCVGGREQSAQRVRSAFCMPRATRQIAARHDGAVPVSACRQVHSTRLLPDAWGARLPRQHYDWGIMRSAAHNSRPSRVSHVITGLIKFPLTGDVTCVSFASSRSPRSRSAASLAPSYINAISGKLVSHQHETPAAEKAEEKADAKAAKAAKTKP